MPPAKPPRKLRRRIGFGLLALTLIVGTALAFLPRLASTPQARRWLLARANRELAPSKLEAKALRLSWFGPNQITGLVLRNKAGKAIVSASRLTLDRGLIAGLSSRPFRGTLILSGLVADVERRADGTSDLAEALAPILRRGDAPPPQAADHQVRGANRAADLTVVIVDGSIRARGPEHPDPLTSRRVNGTLRLPSDAGPVTWRVTLANPSKDDDASLEVVGTLERTDDGSGTPTVETKLTAKRWPWSFASSGVVARGRLDGKLVMERKAGRWNHTGDAQVLDLDATGPALAGDRLRLDEVRGTWDIIGEASTADVKHLDVRTPIGSISGGRFVARTARDSLTRLKGQLDLAALARQLPHALRLRDGLILDRGAAHFVVDIRDGSAPDSQLLAIEARVSDLIARGSDRLITVNSPATLSARVKSRAGALDVETLALKTSFLDASGSGDLGRGVTLQAAFDLGGLRKELQGLIDFGRINLSGKGRLVADYRRASGGAYNGRVAVEVQTLRVAGVSETTIARDLVRVDATATGPVATSGLPESWTRARLGANTGDLALEAALAASETEGVVQIEALRANVQLPPSPSTTGPGPAAPELVRFEAQGRFDRYADTLELRPLPGSSHPGPVVLEGDGLRIAGFRGLELQVAGALGGDLARLDRALAAWNGGEPNDLAGTLSVKGHVTIGEAGRLEVGAAIQAPDLSLARAGGQGRRIVGPLVIGIHADRPKGADRLAFDQLTLASRYARLDASGTLTDPSGTRVADLRGTLTPHWPEIDALVSSSIEPGAKFRCQPRPISLRGPLSGGGVAEIVQGLDAELGLDRFEAVLFGLRLAPAPVVVHARDRGVTIDPIETTLNGGPTHLRPELAFGDNGAITFRFANGSAIQGAEINDEVSRGLLAYIAPVMHDATHVRGKVSVNVQRAEFPLAGGDDAHSTVIGRVEFDDVAFAPGRFASELLGVIGKDKDTALRLRNTVELTVADGRVNERGLAIPIGRDATIELEGSVGFDKTLAMRAKLPIARGLLREGEDVDQLVEALRVGVPIGGTLSHPKIDRRALRLGLRDVDKSALKRSATEFLKKLTKPDGDEADRR